MPQFQSFFIAAIAQKPKITLEEIKTLPHANNIMLKDFAEDLFNEYQKILSEKNDVKSQKASQDEAGCIPF